MGIKNFMGKRAEPEKAADSPILVRDYMTSRLITFKKGENIKDVMDKLIEHNISGGCVVDDNNRLLGVISEGDCIKHISDSRYYNMPMDEVNVEKHMTATVETIDGNMNVLDAAKKFIEMKFRRFPIVEDGVLIGQISQRDVLKAALNLKSQNWH